MSKSTTYPCPRDGQSLAAMPTHPGGASCPVCGGILLRNEAIKAALESNDMDLAKTRTVFDLPAPLACPGCSLPMKGLVLNHPRRHPASKTDVDDFGIFGALFEALVDNLRRRF